MYNLEKAFYCSFHDQNLAFIELSKWKSFAYNHRHENLLQLLFSHINVSTATSWRLFSRTRRFQRPHSCVSPLYLAPRRYKIFLVCRVTSCCHIAFTPAMTPDMTSIDPRHDSNRPQA